MAILAYKRSKMTKNGKRLEEVGGGWRALWIHFYIVETVLLRYLSSNLNPTSIFFSIKQNMYPLNLIEKGWQVGGWIKTEITEGDL